MSILLQMLGSIGLIVWGVYIYASDRETYRTYMLIVTGVVWLAVDLIQLILDSRRKRREDQLTGNAKPRRKLKRKTWIIVLVSVAVLAVAATLGMMATNHTGFFTVYSEPFIVTRTDGEAITQDDYAAIHSALSQRFMESYQKNHMFQLSFHSNGDLLLSVDAYAVHAVRLKELSRNGTSADEFAAFFSQGVFEVKNTAGEVLLNNSDIMSMNSSGGYHSTFNLSETGRKKLSAALTGVSPLILQVYYDGALVNTQLFHFNETIASAPASLDVSLTAKPDSIDGVRYGSGNGRFVPGQLKYTIPFPLPFAVRLSGVKPLDLSVYWQNEDRWDISANGQKTTQEAAE